MTITTEQVQKHLDGSGNVVTETGDKVGGLGQVYLDDATGEPTWVTAKTGLFGTSESFVPLAGARSDGDDIVVSYDKATIKDAPRVESDGSITPTEEQELFRHYGLTSGDAQTEVDSNRDHSSETVGHDTSGPTTDDAMTRSEEQLRVGTQTRESGRAVLRKYVVTENVTQTVPVSREEVRIEREPITEANRGNAESGPAISEEEHEVVLHAETPVVQKEAVPVERVKLGKETVTEQETVSEEVRKEQIETDGVTEGVDPRNTTGR